MENSRRHLTFTPAGKKKRSPPPSEGEELNDGQQRVLDAVKAGKNVFFSGAAGSGKSVVMRHCIEYAKERNGAHLVAVTASTGVAAINISGCTLHAFAGIGLGAPDVKALIKKVRRNKTALRSWMIVEVLFVDEISMIDAQLFDQLEELARAIRRTDEPFGGIQLVLCGDFFQLPPVETSVMDKKDYCFQAKSWNRVIAENVMLKEVFRQAADPSFLSLLEGMRWGRLSQEAVKKLYELSSVPIGEDTSRTKLYARKFQVSCENKRRLKELKGEPEVFRAHDQGLPDQRLKLEKMCPAEQTVELKLGARVILLRNMNLERGLVNGSQGRVIKFVKNDPDEITASLDEQEEQEARGVKKHKADSDSAWLAPELATPIVVPLVKFDNGEIRRIHPTEWTIENMGKVLASRTQIPLSLAYALSIHKSQGMTIGNLEVDLGNCFACGQAYVALSRGRSLEGQEVDGIWAQTVVRNFDPMKVKADPRVVAYYANFS